MTSQCATPLVSSPDVTIVASVKVRDGLILGTDSMTQISAPTPEGPQLLKSYSNARKLFQINEKMAVATYGLGNIGNRSIEGVVLDFCNTEEALGQSVEAVAQALYAFVRGQYDAAYAAGEEQETDWSQAVGFFLVGYSEAQPFPEEFEFLLPRDEAPLAARPAEDFGASWRGIDAPFTRLYKGFDPYVIPPRMEENGITQENIEAILDAVGLETWAIFDGMPVQDAINFAVWILDTTIGWATFQVGSPTCGRPLQVATILADTGFAWVAKPELTVQA
jgi:hypothetical protein